MEKRIIELRKLNEKHQCIICGDENATLKMRINRLGRDDCVTSIHICDKCLVQMQRDIEVCQ